MPRSSCSILLGVNSNSFFNFYKKSCLHERLVQSLVDRKKSVFLFEINELADGGRNLDLQTKEYFATSNKLLSIASALPKNMIFFATNEG